ncbi:Lin0512 family protein, partial [Listeria monocytogenes]
MEQILFIQTGFGVDVHGQNITKAAERAVRNAIFTNSMPGIQ